jgi:hypothetical protein
MKERIDILRDLVSECIITHNEEILVQLLDKLENEYIEIAKLATCGHYNSEWTHSETLDYITKET